MKKKLLVLVLAAVLALGVLGLNAFADSEQTQTATPVATALWTADSSVTVDGSATEANWNFDSRIKGAAGNTTFAKLWNGTDLYFAVKTGGATALKATLNGTVINVTLGESATADKAGVVVKQSGNILEMKVPFASIGFGMHGYSQEMDMAFELTGASGTSSFTGKLTFGGQHVSNSTAGATVHNIVSDSYAKFGYTQVVGSDKKNYKNPTTGVALGEAVELAKSTGQIGAQAATVDGVDGYRIWNKYQAGKTNCMIQYSGIRFTGMGTLANLSGATVVDFDVKIADLPEVKDPRSSAIVNNQYMTTGFGVVIARANSTEELAVSIANVTGKGLVLYVKVGKSTYESVQLNRQLGDTMHLSVRYGKDRSVTVLVDDVKVYYNPQIPETTNAMTSVNNIFFVMCHPSYDSDNTEDIIGSDYVPLSSAYDADVFLSNVKLSTTNEGDVLEELTFDDIKGVNSDPSSVSGDLNLPTTLQDPNGKFTTELVWSSSPAGYISATGKVTPPEKLTEVVLTATVKGTDPAITKNFNLTVSMPPMDAWKADSVTMDGDVSEYHNFTRGYTFPAGAVTGAIGARWDDTKLYIGVRHENAEFFAMQAAGKIFIADLANKTVTNDEGAAIDGAAIATGSGTAEIALPLSLLGINKVEKGTSIGLDVILAGSEEVGNSLLLSFYGVEEKANLNWIGNVTVDGNLTEKAWQMYNTFAGRPGSPAGKIGKLWNEDNLFLAIDTAGATSLKLTVADKTVEIADLTNVPASNGAATAIAKNGDVVELKIPFASFYELYNYGQTIDLSAELTGAEGVSAYTAELTFTSQSVAYVSGAADQKGANPASATYGPAANVTNAAAIGQIGYTSEADVNGNYTYRMWNKYVPGQTNYSVERIISGLKMGTEMASLDGVLTLDFDLCVEDMPAYSDPTSGYNTWRVYQPVGLGILLGRYKNVDESLNLSITNMEDGLVLFVGYGPYTDTYGKNSVPYYGPYKLGKQVGDQFHMTFRYTEDGKVAAYVDDVQVCEFLAGGYDHSLTANSLIFNLWAPYYNADSNKRPAGIEDILNTDSSPKNSNFDMDVTISNVKIGNITCDDLMDLLDFDAIRGTNINQDLVMTDLTLPTTLTDGRLETALTWESSKTEAISTTGTVDTDHQGKVTLTAKLNEQTKKFNLTVAASVLDAWKGSTYTEGRGYIFNMAGKPQGEVNARWDDTNLYLQIENTNATKFAVSLNGKSYSAVVSDGKAEIKVALADLALGKITNSTATPAYVSISNDSGTATKKLQLSFFGAVTVLSAGWEDAVTVNGSTTEGAWQFYRSLTGRPGSPEGKVAALWSNDTVYLAVNAEEAGKMNLVLNGKKAVIDLSTMAVSGMANVTAAKNGNAIEVKIPFASFDFVLYNYGQSVPVQVELEGAAGVSGLSADLTFTAKEHIAASAKGEWKTANAVTAVWSGNMDTAKAIGQLGGNITTDANGSHTYHIWNKYQEGKDNQAIQRTVITSLSLNNAMKSDADIVAVDMDLCIVDMPEYTDPTSGDIIFRSYAPAGLGIHMGRGADDTEMNLSVSNTKDGLVLYVGYGPFTDKYGSDTVPYYGPFKLNKQLGDQFHLSLHYTKDGKIAAYVDDVPVCDFLNGGYSFSVCGTGVSFSLWYPGYDQELTGHMLNEDSSPKNSLADSEVIVSNVKVGSVSCYDLRNLITFDTIKGLNGSPDLVSKDLSLPATVADGSKLSASITWSSSNENVITKTGKVTTPTKDTAVKMTAKLGGQTAFSKDFNLNVVLPTVDAWRTTSANVNGTLAEYHEFVRGYTFPEGTVNGAIAARWTKNTLYLAGKTDGDTMTIVLGGKTITANLTKKTVSGVSGASIAVGSGTVELGIPMSQLNLGTIGQGTTKAMTVTFAKGSTKVQKNLNLTFFGAYETSMASWNDGTIAIDGILNEDWVMYTETTGRVGSPNGVIGKMWNGSDLFVAVDTDGASKLYVTINGKTVDFDLTAELAASGAITQIAKQGDIVEMKLSFKDFFSLVNYGQVIDVKIELENEVGVSGFDGGFEFISREHLAVVEKASQGASNINSDRFGPSQNAKDAVASGQAGYTDTADENGRHTYHLWNIYQAGQKNYPVQRVYTGINMPENVSTQTGTITVDFDVRIDDMPVYTEPTNGDIIWRKYQPAGLGFYAGRNIDGEEINFAISNTADGLVLYVGYGPFTKDYGSGTVQWDGPHKINKALGQEFHVMLHYSEKGELTVYIDDVIVYAKKDVGQDYDLTKTASFGFSLWSAAYHDTLTSAFLNSDSSPKNAAASSDVTISNVQFGNSTGTNILDLIDYDTIRMNNGDSDSVVSNLTLPTSISDGKIAAKLSWSSSNTGAITNTGKVYPQDQRTPVTLTMSLVGAKPAISKTFPLTVVMPFVDTWQTNFVKIDGDLSEYYGLTRGYTFASASGKPSGSIAAGWNKDRSRLYYAIKYTNTTKITITMGSRVIVVDLEKQSISGVKNAQMKIGEKNTVEIAIPLDQVRITEVKNDMLYDIGVKLENTKTSVSKNLTLAFYGQPSTALASWDKGTIVIDGVIDEQSWLLYSLIEGRPGTPEGSFGRLWNGTDLYMAVNTDGAKKMTLQLGEKTMTVDLTKATPVVSGMSGVKIAKNGDFIEMKIPMKSFGFTLRNYTETINMKLELSNNVGTSGFYGVLQFSSREALVNGTKTVVNASNIHVDTFGDEEVVKLAQASGQVGGIGEVNANGGITYHMWDIYQEGQKNYPVQRVNAGALTDDEIAIMKEIDGIMTVDFNVRIDDMPEYKDVEIPDTFFRRYQPAGLGIFIGRNISGEEINFVITNEQAGLAMYMGSGPLDKTYGSGTVQWTGPYYIGKELGQQFHVSVHQTMKGEVQVYIDDEILFAFTDVGEDFALGTSGVIFSLWNQWYAEKYNASFLNEDSSPKNSDANTDLYVSDVQIGTATCYDLLDYLDFDYIKGNNGVYDNVITDLSLPAYLTDGKLKTSLKWESSKSHIVDEKGRVYTQDKDSTVMLKASLVGTDPLQYKEVEVSVALPPVDSWYNASVNLDGKADEYHNFARGYDFVKVSGKPTGSVGAAWDKDTMYVAVKYSGADELKIKIEGKTLKADLAKGTVSGIDGAKIAVGNGIAEIAIPKSILKERAVKEDRVDMVVTLIKGDAETEKGLRMSFYGKNQDGIVGFGGTDMKVDGAIDEIAYQMYGQLDGRMGAPAGLVGKVWSGKDLYLAIFTDDAKTVKLTLNGKTATINPSTLNKTGNLISSIAKGQYSYMNDKGELTRGTLLEMKIPFANFGFDMYAYNLTADMTVEMENNVGVSAYSTTMAFTNRVAKNYINEEKEPSASNPQSSNTEAATAGLKAGNLGTQLTNLDGGRFDFRMWNVYDAKAVGYAEMMSLTRSKANDYYEPMTVLNGDFYFDFDVKIDQMYMAPMGNVKANISGYGNQGLCFWLSRGIEGQEFVGGIAGLKNEGLVFTVRAPATTEQVYCPIPRELGEKFHVTIKWTETGDITVYIDDELLYEVPEGALGCRSDTSPGALGNVRINLNAKSSFGKLSDGQSTDFTVSNILVSSSAESNLLQYLDFEDFKGENRRDTEVWKDMPLPSTVTDGVVKADIVWESSNSSVISIVNGVAKVTPQNEDVKVTLTARMKGNREISRTFEVTVTCPIVDAQLVSTAKTGAYKLADGSTLAARWDKENIYLDITGKTAADVTFCEKKITAANGVVTGIEGGKAAVSGNKVTITLPRSALGITIPEYHTTQRLTVNGKILKLEFVGYDSIADEYLASQSLKDFVATLKKVTSDITLPQTYTSQFVDGKLVVSWSSDTVRVLDNNGKLTRPPKVDTIVRLSLLADGKKLATFDANVIAEGTPDLTSTTDLRVAFGKDIKIDGSISEQGWSMNSYFESNGKVIGKMGAQWDTEYLYLAFEYSSAKALTIELEGKTANINLANLSASGDLKIAQIKKGSYLELKIAMKDLGLSEIVDYGDQLSAKIMLDGTTFDGTFTLTSIQWFATDNSAHRYVKSEDTMDEEDTSEDDEVLFGDVTANETEKEYPNKGWSTTNDGYYLYDVYDYNGVNKAGLSTAALFVKKTTAGTEVFAPMELSGQVGLYTEFDFQSLSMPIYEGGVKGDNKAGSHTFVATAGFSFQIGGYANKIEKTSEWISMGIYMSESGLVLMVRVGKNDFYSVPLGKQNGDMFRLGMAWNKDDTLFVFLDGEKIFELEKAVTYGTAMSSGGIAFRITRNKLAAECDSDNFKIKVSNVAMGYYYGECVLDNISFEDIRGENINYAALTMDLDLMKEYATPQLSSGKLTWESTDPAVAGDGTVTCPEDKSYALARLTVSNKLGHSKEILTAVKGHGTQDDILYLAKDYDIAHGAGQAYTSAFLTLDQNNSSIIKDLKEVQKVNVVKLKDLDHKNRLYEDTVSLWVSDDNANYTEIKDFSFYQNGTETYLYGFETEARYIKVHVTNHDEAESMGECFYPEMINAYYEEIFGDNGSSFGTKKTVTVKNSESYDMMDMPWDFTASELGIVSLADNMADIRIFCGDKLLYHYVENGMIYVRIPEVKAGGKVKLTVLSGNKDALDISNKEFVYEVIYGTRELIPYNAGSAESFYRIRCMYTLPDGTIVTTVRATAALDHQKNDSRMWQYSKDNGRTWVYMGAAEEFLVGPAPGGFVYDQHANILYSFGYGSVEEGITQLGMVKLDLNNGIENAKWEYAGNLSEGYIRAINYNNGTTLSCYDGDGPNTDMIVAWVSSREGPAQTESYTRVSYTKDAGKTWHVSETGITIAGVTPGFERGCSEPSTIELEDGTLVVVMRYQDVETYSFGYAYSTDQGVTWSDAVPSNIYTINTQPMFLETNDEFDVFTWAGNNIQGGNSYQRYPQNVAIPVVEEDYSNIKVMAVQNTLLRLYHNNLKVDNHRNTNLYVTYTADGALLYSSPMGSSGGGSFVTRVDDYKDYITKSKGSYDSFEKGSTKYEGWADVQGTSSITDKLASDGSYSMQVYGQTVRPVPYFRTGSVSFDLNWTKGTTFKLELETTYSLEFGLGSPVAVIVDKDGNLLDRDGKDTGIDVAEGWNKIYVDADLPNGKATVSANDGEAVVLTIDEIYSEYVTYVAVTADNYVYVDNFTQIGEPADVKPETKTEGDAGFDLTAILIVGAIVVVAAAGVIVIRKKKAKK